MTSSIWLEKAKRILDPITPVTLSCSNPIDLGDTSDDQQLVSKIVELAKKMIGNGTVQHAFDEPQRSLFVGNGSVWVTFTGIGSVEISASGEISIHMPRSRTSKPENLLVILNQVRDLLEKRVENQA